MTNSQEKTLKDWLFRQAPVIIILIITNIAQYNYFTKQIAKLEDKVEKLQDKLLYRNHK